MTITPEQSKTIEENWQTVNDVRRRARVPKLGIAGVALMALGVLLNIVKAVPSWATVAIVIIGALSVIPVGIQRFKAQKACYLSIHAIADVTQEIMKQVNNPGLCDPFSEAEGTRTTVSFPCPLDEDDINDAVAIDLGDRYFLNVIYKGEQAWLYVVRYNEPIRFIRASVSNGTVTLQSWILNMSGVEQDLSPEHGDRSYKAQLQKITEQLQQKIVTYRGA